jgi:ABC-type nickel/cobalt efflux system permease component RcnA
MNRLIPLFILCIVLLAPVATLANNPFASGHSRPESPVVEASPGFSNPVITRMVMLQHSLKQKITQKVRQAKAEKSIKPLFALVLLSFSYGVLHAAGPGHGKAVATSYLFSRGRRLGNGLLLGNLIALFHALSAVILVVVLREILDVSITGSLDKTSLVMQKISYALIATMGTGLLIRNVINWRKLRQQDTPVPEVPKRTNILAMAFFTGMVPCPGVVLIMLFTMSMDMVALGMVLSLATALGMGLTISAVVTVVLKGKTLTLGRLDQRPGLAETVELSFELAGALMVTLLGLLLFGTLPPMG